MHEVERLPVRATEFVRRVETTGDIRRDARRQRRAHPLAPRGLLQEHRQRLAVRILHDDVVAPVGAPEDKLPDLHHVGVPDGRRDAGLVRQHRHEVRVIREVGVHHLDGHDLPRPGDALVDGEKHRRHPAARQFGDDAVVVQT